MPDSNNCQSSLQPEDNREDNRCCNTPNVESETILDLNRVKHELSSDEINGNDDDNVMTSYDELTVDDKSELLKSLSSDDVIYLYQKYQTKIKEELLDDLPSSDRNNVNDDNNVETSYEELTVDDKSEVLRSLNSGDAIHLFQKYQNYVKQEND